MSTFINDAWEVIDIEINAIKQIKQSIGDEFNQACEILKNCQGHVIVVGMGKSGHIGAKMAATFASTGTPSLFVHPAEAGHGDFGMITKNDVVIAISNSGSTPEVTQLLPLIKRLGLSYIALTGKPESILAQQSNVMLNIAIPKEACPHNLAPTASTTATLVMGDALAIALLKSKGMTPEDFAFSHPSGSLGKRLLLHVRDVMRKDKSIPVIKPQMSIEETILEMTNKGLGMTVISEDYKNVQGIFTDGDLRRIFQSSEYQKGQKIISFMTTNPKTIHVNELAVKALQLMEDCKITTLIAVDDQNLLAGVVHMHDLIQQGIA